MTEAYLKAKENAIKIQRSISNIIWLDGRENYKNFIKLISDSLYIAATEVSLFNIFETPEPTHKDIFDLKTEIFEANVNISGVHNIFADIENFNDSFFTSDRIYNKVIDRVKKYIDYTKMLDVEDLSLDYMDFLKLNGMNRKDADIIFFNFLKEIEEYTNGEIDIHIVPTSEKTRDFMNNYVEAIEFVKKGKFNNIKVLIDLKEIFDTLSFDLKYFRDNEEYLKHFHISNLDGGPITFTDIPMHNKIVNTSYNKDYKNKFFVMKIKNLSEEDKSKPENYDQYIHVFKEIYQVPLELSAFCSRLFLNLVYRHLSAEGPDIEHLFNYDQH
jgi:sugar phosphate isomerase/epimerase